MKSKLLNNSAQKTYAVILESNEQITECMLRFVRQQNIKAAQFNAIGAVSRATLGFFDFEKKDYKKIEIPDQSEVLVLSGDVSIFNNEPKIHAHVVLGKKDGAAQGGHLLAATVHPTLEIILTESPSFLEREMDQETGLPLIRI